jgi:hypothetical protein
VQRLQLELERIDRDIRRARGEGRGTVSELAERRALLKGEFDRAYALALDGGEGEAAG